MKWLESAIAYLFPTILIEDSSWRQLWKAQQRIAFLRLARFTFPSVAIGYLFNYYFFDIPMGLEPTGFWLRFRLAVAIICLATFTFYLSPMSKYRYYQIPAFLASFVVCHSQAWVTIWYGKEAWFFFFLFVLVSTMVLRLTSFQSFCWGVFVIGVSVPVMIAGSVSIENIMSGTIACLVVSIIVRSTSYTDALLFISNQENEMNQRRLLELNSDYADRVKSFIPKVIADRLTHLMEKQRLSVVEASIEALKARKKYISCLFTDIRGYTQGSKDIDKYVSDSVFPEVTACSRAIEELQGIPRKVGDLIFAYFDDDSVELNLVRSILGGIEVSRINKTMNMTSSAIEIERYILIATGEAMVGNFGGLDSSVEITALGPPVNFLSRVDDLTKSHALSEILHQGDLIICEKTAQLAGEIGIPLEKECLDLEKMGLDIRDFPEVKILYRLTNPDDAYNTLSEFLKVNGSY